MATKIADVTKNQIAKFTIHESWVRHHPEKLLPLFACLVVLRCEFLYAISSFKYEAIGSIFPIKDFAFQPPELLIAVKVNELCEIEQIEAVSGDNSRLLENGWRSLADEY